MHLKNMTLFILGLTLVFVGQGCKDDCGNGYRKMGDVCQCPNGKYETNGICRALMNNEYYGTRIDCDCPDSMFFMVGEKEFNASSGKTVVRIQNTYGNSYDSNAFSWPFYYYPMSTGDSLEGDFSIPGCPINNIPTQTAAAWAKYIGTDTIKLWMINEITDPPFLRDTCIWYLHK